MSETIDALVKEIREKIKITAARDIVSPEMVDLLGNDVPSLIYQAGSMADEINRLQDETLKWSKQYIIDAEIIGHLTYKANKLELALRDLLDLIDKHGGEFAVEHATRIAGAVMVLLNNQQ
jgi:hypothetical protein